MKEKILAGGVNQIEIHRNINIQDGNGDLICVLTQEITQPTDKDFDIGYYDDVSGCLTLSLKNPPKPKVLEQTDLEMFANLTEYHKYTKDANFDHEPHR